jgi:hypothetical protein
MKRTPQVHSRAPNIGILGRLFVGLLALPFGVGSALALARGAWLDALLFAAMFLLAGYAAWTGIHLYARRAAPHAGGLPRGPHHPKTRKRSPR